MDSLIVLRKHLRKTQLDPKFPIPKKSKKAVPRVDPIPPNAGSGESNRPPISFVKLYRDLCLEKSIRATSWMHASSQTGMRMSMHVSSTGVDLNSAARVDVNSPGRLHVNTPASCVEAPLSDTSLVTHYFGTEVECNRVFLFTDLPPPSSARAELIIELDYDTSSKDSGFC